MPHDFFPVVTLQYHIFFIDSVCCNITRCDLRIQGGAEAKLRSPLKSGSMDFTKITKLYKNYQGKKLWFQNLSYIYIGLFSRITSFIIRIARIKIVFCIARRAVLAAAFPINEPSFSVRSLSYPPRISTMMFV